MTGAAIEDLSLFGPNVHQEREELQVIYPCEKQKKQTKAERTLIQMYYL